MAWDSWTHVFCKKEQKFTVKVVFGSVAWPQRFGGSRKTELGCESVCAGPAPSQAPSPLPPAQPHLHDKQDVQHSPCLLY